MREFYCRHLPARETPTSAWRERHQLQPGSFLKQRTFQNSTCLQFGMVTLLSMLLVFKNEALLGLGSWIEFPVLLGGCGGTGKRLNKSQRKINTEQSSPSKKSVIPGLSGFKRTFCPSQATQILSKVTNYLSPSDPLSPVLAPLHQLPMKHPPPLGFPSSRPLVHRTFLGVFSIFSFSALKNVPESHL